MFRAFTARRLTAIGVTRFANADDFFVIHLARRHHPGGAGRVTRDAIVAAGNRNVIIALARCGNPVMTIDATGHVEIELRVIELSRHPRRGAMTIIATIGGR